MEFKKTKVACIKNCNCVPPKNYLPANKLHCQNKTAAKKAETFKPGMILKTATEKATQPPCPPKSSYKKNKKTLSHGMK